MKMFKINPEREVLRVNLNPNQAGNEAAVWERAGADNNSAYTLEDITHDPIGSVTNNAFINQVVIPAIFDMINYHPASHTYYAFLRDGVLVIATYTSVEIW